VLGAVVGDFEDDRRERAEPRLERGSGVQGVGSET
jgi:hypothetical protein